MLGFFILLQSVVLSTREKRKIKAADEAALQKG
jgi:hypothetical protein